MDNNLVNRAHKFKESLSLQSLLNKEVLNSVFPNGELPQEAITMITERFMLYTVGVNYKVGHVFRYEGILYQVIKDHTSEAKWVPNANNTSNLYQVYPLQNLIASIEL